ncbi:hypothetical protein CLAVI_000932 [Candidatus Clavichlamydia salmonicola]|uniref:hypothetical protein n=1 Tax=Candidatus Clavichlamydia salmonicola TaxID=469812 RepID=UPI001891B8AF|nr:hypothetical protein [Candidatus Clavichlamydia salmonicola]MBF5051291.1 hypothetical protein [Candidatus Clavichlamydia salmonicola]
MHYFTLNYSNFLFPDLPTSFIIEESITPLNNQNIASLTNIVKNILSQRLPCVSVPPSFPLNTTFHSNTLSILQAVIIPLVKESILLNNTKAFQDSIKELNFSIASCLLSYNFSSFAQAPPKILDTSSITCPHQSLKRISSLSTSLIQTKKSRLDSSHEEKSSLLSTKSHTLKEASEEASLLLNEDEFTNSWILEALKDFPLETYELINTDLLEETYSKVELNNLEYESNVADHYFLPFIEVLETNQHFIIKNQQVSNISLYLEHLYNGITHVLEAEMLFIDPNKLASQAYSTSSLYHTTLQNLLSLLNNQQRLLQLIPIQEERQSFSIEHKDLSDKIMIRLQASGFADSTIKKLTEDAPIACEKESLSSSNNESIIHPNSKNNCSLKILLNEDTLTHLPDETVPQQKSILTQTICSNSSIFYHVKIKNRHTCHIFLDNEHQELATFLIQLEKITKNSAEYICLQPIHGITPSRSTSRYKLLQALYFILYKNTEHHSSTKYIYPKTYVSISKTANTINQFFCDEIQEKVNTMEHHPELIKNVGIQKLLPTESVKPFQSSHYQIILKDSKFLFSKIITIEAYHFKASSNYDLLKQKASNIAHMLAYFKVLNTTTTVIIGKKFLPNFENNKTILVADLAPFLLQILNYNKYEFIKIFQQEQSFSILYKRIMEHLEKCIGIVNDIISKTEKSKKQATPSNIPSLNIIESPSISPESKKFVFPIFMINPRHTNKEVLYYISYSAKQNKKLLCARFLILRHIKKLNQIINLLLKKPSLPIFYSPYKSAYQKTPISNSKELRKILHQGVHENLLYIKKYLFPDLSPKAKKIFCEELETAITLVEKSILPTDEFPIITAPLTLEKVFKDLIQKDQIASTPSKKSQQFIQQIGPTNQSSYKIFFFALAKTYSSLKHPISSYQMSYTNKKRTNIKASWKSYLQKILFHQIQLFHHIRDNNFKIFKITYIDPLTHQNNLITNVHSFLKIILEGFNENLTFFLETFPSLVASTSQYELEKDYRLILSSLCTELHLDISSLNPPSILKNMAQQSLEKANQPQTKITT